MKSYTINLSNGVSSGQEFFGPGFSLSRQTQSSSERVSTKSFVVVSQKLGAPNRPTVNRLSWIRDHKTYFSGVLNTRRLSGVPYTLTSTPCVFGILPDSWGGRYNDGSEFSVAYSKFLGKLRDSKANLAVDVAEGGQTFRMVSSAVDRVLHFASKARRHPTKALSDAWLEYKYGWQPALSTIYELAQFSKTNILRRKITASALGRYNYTINGLSGYNVKSSYSYTSVVRWGCTMQISNPLTYDINRLTSLNPLSIAWELVPYSFVVDWFLDIGGFLSDVETVCSMGFDVQNLYQTVYRNWYGDHVMDDYDEGYYVDLGNTIGSREAKAHASSVRTTYDRFPVASLPIPRFPSFQPHLGASRILSAAALLSQFRK